MEKLSLTVATRTVLGKKVQALRVASIVPAIIYGHGVENRYVQVPIIPFEKLFTKAGESSLIDLVVDSGASLKVLIHDVQRDPVTSTINHVDFYQVKMTEKLTAHIPIVHVGESRAVKELGGVLVKTLDHINVECLPQDLPHELTVDLTTLEQFDDAIRVSDIPIPAGVTVKSDPQEMVLTVKAPRTEEEVKADLATPATENIEAVEVAEKKGKEKEEEVAPEPDKK